MATELSLPYRREDHENACPCKLCVAFDIAYMAQTSGEQWASSVSAQGVFDWITRERSKKLNWDVPSDHCILCGGTRMDAWTLKDHYEIHRHNEQEKDGRFYSSLLLHKDGSMFAVYKQYVEKSGGWDKIPFKDAKTRFVKWACQLMDLLPAKCTERFAARDIGDWIELRLEFTELVEETREQRIERYVREAGKGRDQVGTDPRTDQQVPAVPGAVSLARHINSVLAAMPGRDFDLARGQQDAGPTDY